MFGLTQRERDMADMRQTIDDFGEERANLQQRIGELQTRVDNMTLRDQAVAVDAMATKAAAEIDDIFAQANGGVVDRRARVRSVIREQLQKLCTGEVS